MHVYNTTMPTGVARAPAAAVLRGDQSHVAAAVADRQLRLVFSAEPLERLRTLPERLAAYSSSPRSARP
jgi:hypothetical protein